MVVHEQQSDGSAGVRKRGWNIRWGKREERGIWDIPSVNGSAECECKRAGKIDVAKCGCAATACEGCSALCVSPLLPHPLLPAFLHSAPEIRFPCVIRGSALRRYFARSDVVWSRTRENQTCERHSSFFFAQSRRYMISEGKGFPAHERPLPNTMVQLAVIVGKT